MKNLKLITILLATLLYACQGQEGEKETEPSQQVHYNEEIETEIEEDETIDKKEENSTEQVEEDKPLELSDLDLPDDVREFLEAEKQKDSIIFSVGKDVLKLDLNYIIEVLDNFPQITQKNVPNTNEVIDFYSAKRNYTLSEQSAVYLTYAYLQYNINDINDEQWEVINTYVNLQNLSLDFTYAQLNRGNFGYETFITSFIEALQWALHDKTDDSMRGDKFQQECKSYLSKVEKQAWANFEDKLPYEYYDDQQEARHRENLKQHIKKLKTKIDTPMKLQMFKQMDFTLDKE